MAPAIFARIHPRFRTPHVTTILTGIVVGGVAMITDIGALAELTNIGTLFAFALVCAGVMVLRRTDPSRVRPFRVPLVPLFPILGILLCFALMMSLPLDTWVR
ncbi:MAG TPA: amino acid permease, partial [Candidatus Binatia bacterium]|nr:amino acid permease [Candidatus Binatia bacterium]